MTRHFVVIGGMKCGSTTLYHDLLASRGLFLAPKESDILLAGDPDAIQNRYQEAFGAASQDTLRGEVCTNYAKRPDTQNVALGALEHFGPSTKLIYVIRDPVKRTISHHYHMHSWRGVGHMEADINRCVHKYPSLVDYSRYAWQLEPWLQHFPLDSIRIVLFEDYVANRPRVVTQLCDFLGVQVDLQAIETTRVHNASHQKPVLNSTWSRVRGSGLYRAFLRDWIPGIVRKRFISTVLPKAPPRPRPPKRETVDYIRDAVRSDVEQLQQLLGLDSPPWDLDCSIGTERAARIAA